MVLVDRVVPVASATRGVPADQAASRGRVGRRAWMVHDLARLGSPDPVLVAVALVRMALPACRAGFPAAQEGSARADSLVVPEGSPAAPVDSRVAGRGCSCSAAPGAGRTSTHWWP